MVVPALGGGAPVRGGRRGATSLATNQPLALKCFSRPAAAAAAAAAAAGAVLSYCLIEMVEL